MIKYKFNNEDNFQFYILNAVCHDWIHDFNNYKRMGKLLEVILELVDKIQQPEVKAAFKETDYAIPDAKRTAIDTTATTLATTTSVSLDEFDALFNSTADEYFINTQLPIPISSNQTIALYNNIRYNRNPNSELSIDYNKIYLLQLLEEFIGECVFLIISYSQKNSKADILYSIHFIMNEIVLNQQLKNVFHFIKDIYSVLEIPGASAIEIINNSLIFDATSIFIIGKCNNLSESYLYLNTLLNEFSSSPDLPPSTPVKPKTAIGMSTPFSVTDFLFSPLPPLGGALSLSTFNSINDDKLTDAISSVKSSLLYSLYNYDIIINDENCGNIETVYLNFINNPDLISILQNITGVNLFKVKTTYIQKKFDDIKTTSSLRIKNTYIQLLTDAINDFVFDKIIFVYEDFVNRKKAVIVTASSLPSETRVPVQEISKLVAFKTLQLTGAGSSSSADLNKQIEIIRSVSNGENVQTVDDLLIRHFIDNAAAYGLQTDLLQFNMALSDCPNCRIINNAISSKSETKQIILDKTVACPTSSVCDAMNTFGSCSNPSDQQKEFYNMDFEISFNGDDDSNNSFYYGKTILKSNFITIDYGFKYKMLEVYNSIEMGLKNQPIQLQANFTFKTVINKIVEIWNNISDDVNIWEVLRESNYFISILKLGSQKAVGDIFQEINTALENGGYSDPRLSVSKINDVKTFGLMGDRPSGIRVVNLLKNAYSGKNENAYGGYIGKSHGLVYFNIEQPIGSNNRKRKRTFGGKNFTVKKKRYNKKILSKRNQLNKRRTYKKKIHKNKRTRK